MKSWCDKSWFEKHILYVSRTSNGDCDYLYLFGEHIDFRQFYVYDDDPDKCWFLEWEVKDWAKKEEKRNARRKNKIPISTYRKIPWYKTIIKWRSLWSRFKFFRGFAFGCLLGYLLGVNL